MFATALLTAPAPALALGGGGSGGFGGGGGGGGFGGGFGGHGLIFGPAWLVIAVFLARLVLAAYRRDAWQRRRDGRPPLTLGLALSLLTLWLLWPFVVAGEGRRRRQRVRRIRLAAAEASEDDPAFAVDVVHGAAEGLFRDIQAAWSRDDRERLAALVGDTLMVEWNGRLADFSRRGWRNEVDVIGELRIDYVGLVNRGDERSNEVCVRIAARVRDVVRDARGETVRRRGSVAEVHRVCQYWTLGRRDACWIVVRIQERREGMHELRAPIVATPWADGERLRREAISEQAAESSVPAADIAAVGRPAIDEAARLAALDLSLVDGRFAPDVLVSEVGYAVAAWVAGIDGDRAALEQIAGEHPIAELLYPDGPRTRYVVRGLEVGEVRIVEVATDRVPPAITVEVHATGIAYTEDRSTLIVISGDRARRRSLSQRWCLELSGATMHPWRIVDAAAPARA